MFFVVVVKQSVVVIYFITQFGHILMKENLSIILMIMI
jgi:hypothetical protein